MQNPQQGLSLWLLTPAEIKISQAKLLHKFTAVNHGACGSRHGYFFLLCPLPLALWVWWFNVTLCFSEQFFLRPHCFTLNIFVVYSYAEYNSNLLWEIRACQAYYFSLQSHYIKLIWLESRIFSSHMLFFFSVYQIVTYL